jgi:hypothetical protein
MSVMMHTCWGELEAAPFFFFFLKNILHNLVVFMFTLNYIHFFGHFPRMVY